MYSEGGECSQSRRSMMDPIEESSGSPIRRRRRRFCSLLACFNRSSVSVSASSSTWWQKLRAATMWSRGVGALKRIREWSEIVAGPRWKTLVRRLKRRKKQANIVQYDPLSYALNFDEGVGPNLEGDDEYYGWNRNFSSRYANSRGPLDSGEGPAFV